MPTYVDPPIVTDPALLAQDAFDEFATRVPGWSPAPGNAEVITIEVSSFQAAEGRDVASAVPRRIFFYFGETLANLPPEVAASASTASTWTAIDDQGYTIPEGAVVGVRAAGDELALFRVDAAVSIPPGSTATTAGAVALVAMEEGEAGNELGGVGAPAELVDTTLTWVDSVVLTAETGGGADAEPEEEYLDRLVEELLLQTPRPILPEDFAILAKRVPTVDRALAIDLYKPEDAPNPGDPEDTNAERSVTVVPVDEDGEPVSAGTKTAVRDLLQGKRETTFDVWVIDPTYTEVAATFAATAYAGWDAADVEARALAALEAYLEPADWGTDPYSFSREWTTDDKVRFLEVAEVLNRVDGLWRVDSLTVGEEGGAMGDADVQLDGPAPLPRAGTIVGAVSAP
jgi:hypothetical protein